MGNLTKPRGFFGLARPGSDPFAAMEKWMDHYFPEAQDRPSSWLKTSKDWEKEFGHFNPKVDIRDSGDSVHISAELPGMSHDDVEVNLERDRVAIKGEKKFAKEGDEDDRHYVERRYGSFYRVVPLPYEVDQERAQASFANGVLSIDLSRCAEDKKESRRINIKP